MTRRVLITRPQEDAVPLAEKLAAVDLDSTIAPLLTIVFKDGPPISLENVQALLMTSANGVRAFCRRQQERDLPLFAVGNATASIAAKAGFKNVISASGDVAALAELVQEKLDPKQGALLHAAGTRVAGDLAGTLEAAGFSVRRETLYAADLATELPLEVIKSLQQRELDAVLVYSPRTAKILVTLIKAAGVETACHTVTVFCLSQAVADQVRALKWQDVRISEAPNQDALLAAISLWSRNSAP